MRQLRQRGVATTVIGLTANALQEDTEAFVEAGANAVLIKPLNVKGLLKYLHTYFGDRAE